MKLNRKWLLLVALVLSVAMATTGTLAYLTDEDKDVNTMTLGKVEIVQNEQERRENGLDEFTQGKPLYPAVYPGSSIPWADESKWPGEGGEAWKVVEDNSNVVDKFVTVTNTSKTSDAYVRTIIAYEGDATYGPNGDYIHIVHNTTNVDPDIIFEDVGYYTIDGVTYTVFVYTYPEAVAKQTTTIPSLKQVYMDKKADNDVVAYYGEQYDIIALSQAIQVNGFEEMGPAAALNEGFGEVTETNLIKWLAETEIGSPNGDKNDTNNPPGFTNPLVEYNGVIYDDLYAGVEAAEAAGGTVRMLGPATLDKTLDIPANITIDGSGYTLRRAEGFTGTMFNAKAGVTLTTENLIMDGAGATATGNLISAEANAQIVLNAGTVLQNNNGAHAVNLGTRIGATLTLNGAYIINNSSDSGAIWGGGNIIINEGSKINNNSSTGSAGAIRMVSNCNLTMNGGEISNNTAAGSGGAIYGYGSSTYNFNGGEMSGNTAALGGAMYTGDSSVVNISGDFELCNNTADDAGALRLSNRTAFNMSGGKVSGNESKNSPAWDGFYGWNPGVNISGGELADDVTIQGGLTPTVGGGNVTGIIYFDVSTNHNTVNLAVPFNSFKFHVAEGNNFAAFNLKPDAGYTYTAGDENKLICVNEGYSTYWNESTSAFKIQAN